MKIEAVSVCVEYGDFLAHALPQNKGQFDRWVIVTAPHDEQTRALCEHYHVECVVTDAFFANDKAFDKAAGINAGLARLKRDGWVAHIDADIVLPPRGREMIERGALDQRAIYGIDRMLCESFEDWCRHLSWPEIMHSNGIIVAQEFPHGARLLKSEGWAPIGFFQLWNPGTSGIATYPDHGSVDRGDVAFARLWPREWRHLIPELLAIHLASEHEDGMGRNWRGRRSQPFGPQGARHRRHGVYCDR